MPESATRAVIYARYSSASQTEQSIEGQLKDCYAFAERHGWQVIGEYIDRAISGKTDERPDFQRMIDDAKKRQFQRIIVWKLDRFARNRYDSAIYKRRLKLCGVTVVSAMQNVGESDESILLEALLEAADEYYSLDLAKKVKRGMRVAAEKGQYVGGVVPFGYKVDGHRLVVHEAQAQHAQYVFAEYAAGTRAAEILEQLRAYGVRSNRGGTIGHNFITSIIKNRKYIGEMLYKGELVEGGCPALIDAETFLRANERLQRNQRGGRPPSESTEYLLAGKAFCGLCGAPLHGESGHGRHGGKYEYYLCSAKKKRLGCAKKSEKKGFLEWYAVEQTAEYVLRPDIITYVAGRIVAEYEKEFGVSQVKELEKRIAALEAEIERNIDLTMSAPTAKMAERYRIRAEQLDAEQTDLQVDLSKLRVACRISLSADEVAAWLRQFCSGDPLDEPFSKKIIDALINSVIVYDDKVVIYYNVKDGQQVSYIGPPQENEEAEPINGVRQPHEMVGLQGLEPWTP